MAVLVVPPEVRTGQVVARATIMHYCRDRLFDAHLWKKIGSGTGLAALRINLTATGLERLSQGAKQGRRGQHAWTASA